MQQIDITRIHPTPTILFQNDGHTVYWLGICEPTAFRTNTYLVCDGEQALLIDPGNRTFFSQVKQRVAQILPPEQITDIIASHQDPDVIASLSDWLTIAPDLKVHTSPRTQVLLPYYGTPQYTYVDNEQAPVLTLGSGTELHFIPAPFLHFPGAFATYDTTAHCLFSGDIFASLDTGIELWVEDFEALCANMRLFHTEYMASNIAARGFTRRLNNLQIDTLLPQHGCLISREFVAASICWLAQLPCGTDLLYPDLD